MVADFARHAGTMVRRRLRLAPAPVFSLPAVRSGIFSVRFGLVVSFACCVFYTGCGLSTSTSTSPNGKNTPATATISGAISPAADGGGVTVTLSGVVALSGAASATTVADASGNYSFPALANGSYSITPTKSGFGFSPTVEAVTVSGTNVSTINFTAKATSAPSYSISGTISSAPNSGVIVTLSGDASASTVADAAGNYSFPALPNGSYSVTPSQSGFGFAPTVQAVTLNGANVSSVNFTADATSGPSYTISGTINSAPNSGVTVTLSGAATAATVTDASGNYSFPALANGSYSITPSQSGFGFSPNTQAALVNGASVTGMNFTASTVISTPAIPATFFAVSDTYAGDPPQISYGAMGHPIQLVWETSEQSKGVFDFSSFDALAGIAPTDTDGTALIDLTLGMTPGWATSQQTTCRTEGSVNAVGCTAPPDNIQDWTDFITALMNHYNGVNAPHIKYYELWNEADPNSTYWTGTAAQLEQLAAAAYPIIKRDGHSLVIAPSMAGNVYSTGPYATLTFLASYLAAGGSDNADIAAFHGFIADMTLVPYPLPTEPCSATDTTCGGSITAQVAAYRQVLDQNGMTGKPLFNTEGGFEGADIPDMDTKAAWLAQYYALQASMYNSAQIQFVSWFTWGGDAQLAGSLETDSHQPSEVGIAYTQVFNWLVGRSLASPCSNSGNLWTCALAGTNGYQAEIIWDASQTCSGGTCTTSNQSVASIYVRYQDVAGNSTTISNQTVPVGLKPILLENQ
jgi:hypothetical protein